MQARKRAGTGTSASAKLLWSLQFLFPGGESKSKVALKSMASAPAMLAWLLLVAKHPGAQLPLSARESAARAEKNLGAHGLPGALPWPRELLKQLKLVLAIGISYLKHETLCSS